MAKTTQGALGALELILKGLRSLRVDCADYLSLVQLPLDYPECENPEVCIDLTEEIQVTIQDTRDVQGDKHSWRMKWMGVVNWTKEEQCLNGVIFLKADFELISPEGTHDQKRLSAPANQMWEPYLGVGNEKAMILSQMERCISGNHLGLWGKMEAVIDWVIPAAESFDRLNSFFHGPDISSWAVTNMLMQIHPQQWAMATAPPDGTTSWRQQVEQDNFKAALAAWKRDDEMTEAAKERWEAKEKVRIQVQL